MARELIAKGVYICEYKTSLVFPAKSDEQDECHACNTRGMYIMETALEVERGSGRLCFDATDRLHHPGHYINHMTRGANVKPANPQYIRGKWRVFFLALRDVEEGEELCYDYGLRMEEVWTRKGRLVDGKVTCGKDRVGTEAKAEVKQEGERKARGAAKILMVPYRGMSFGTCAKDNPTFLYCTPPAHFTSRASLMLRKHKRCLPQEAINKCIPNPYACHRLGSNRALTDYITPGPSRGLPEYVELHTEVSCRSPGGSKGRKGKGRGDRVLGNG